MNEVVEKLWELQSALSELTEKEELLNTKPASFAAVDREYQEASARAEQLQTQLEQFATVRRRIEGELQDQQELLKKYQGQLMQVKNQQQYSAAWKEIDVTRRQVKEQEDLLLATMTEAEEAQKQFDEGNVAAAPLKDRHQAAYQEWQSSLGELRSEIAAIRERITRIESGVPPRARNEFRRIFSHRQGVAITLVEKNSCGACRVRIRPQVSQQLQRGELVYCEGCRRVLYLETETP
ncbi:MAG: C4-type zinc ribbon domain-containing protein [Acidobacteriota bacterium]